MKAENEQGQGKNHGAVNPRPLECMVTPLRIIFLDIDGVLVNSASLKERSGKYSKAHPDCVAALNEIVNQTGAKIVVSSTWRIYGETEVAKILKDWGVKACCLAITPDLTRKIGYIHVALERGDEIQAWLDTPIGRKVKSFVILDDDSDMKHLKHRLVQTLFVPGLTMRDAERAIDVLLSV